MKRLERVEAREVSKIYGRQRALWKVSLTLERGKVTALLGPNGSGKTTLLTLFSTLSRPTHGTLHFDDLPPNKAGDARSQIGLLSHAALIYGELTAAENVAFFGKLYGVADPEKRARELLESFGLGDAMDRAARTFSRGMLQRLGLARALIGDPALVLLDEPFTGLDRASTERVVEKVGEMRDRGAMVLMISHDLATTAALADETAILSRGRLVAQHKGRGTVEQLANWYAAAASGKEETRA